MKPPVGAVCEFHHTYYHEAEAAAACPYCLATSLSGHIGGLYHRVGHAVVRRANRGQDRLRRGDSQEPVPQWVYDLIQNCENPLLEPLDNDF